MRRLFAPFSRKAYGEKMVKMRVRNALVREVAGKKVVRNKLYRYTYYTLPLNIYIPKGVVEKYGREYVVIVNTDTGEIRAMPKPIYEQKLKQKQGQKTTSAVKAQGA